MIRAKLIAGHILKRSFSSKVHIAGHGWTGALGTGVETMLSPRTSSVSPTERDNGFQSLPSTQFDNIINSSAGWGHTVLVNREEGNEDKIYVAGRLYDFQTLMRLYRMPTFVRRIAVKQSLFLERVEEPGLIGRMVDKLFTHVNEKFEKEKYQRAIFPEFTEMKLPDGDVPLKSGVWHQKTLSASAGLTAVVGMSGKVYTFGINQRGQCGIGDRTMHHVWEPRPVILKKGESIEGVTGDPLEDVTSVDLGLQHGLALDRSGNLFGWGKGSRGQLGNSHFKTDDIEDGKESIVDMEFGAIQIDDFEIVTEDARSKLTGSCSNVRNISAGWNHSAAITESNHAWIWGKNAIAEVNDGKFKAVDSPAPTIIQGLPKGIEIKDISCGSHHTSILMEDGSVYAIGISTDTAQPIGNKAVQILPAGIIDLPVRQFSSHFDRTTIISGDIDKQVLEVQLWSTEELRNKAVFEPEWVESLTYNDAEISMVHRGWLHTVVITEDR